MKYGNINISSRLRFKLIWGGIFAITMGYFEATLVEYLRALFYPNGFEFPLIEVPLRFILMELGREAMSILMLWSVAMLIGRVFIDRFAGFMYMFGIWDITYYLFLLLFEGWPSSLFTEDVLFLIPLPWTGPVWAPVLVSLALIWAAVVIWLRIELGTKINLTKVDWTLEIIAGVIIIISFCWRFMDSIKPESLPPFPWYIWLAGMILGVGIFLKALIRTE